VTDEQPHITLTKINGVDVVDFEDRKILEEFTITQIGDGLAELIDGKPEVKLLLSFAKVEHLSSAALGMLIKLHNLVSETGGQMKLADISEPIFEVFKITRLNKLFKIHDTKEDALRDFG